MADLSTARSSELVGFGVDHPGDSTGMGTVSALAEGPACRVCQLDHCR